jgi:hypothetical protein
MRTSSEFYTLIALHVNVFVDLLDYISSVYHLGLQHVSDELVDELERDDPLLKKRGPRSRALSNVSIILVFRIDGIECVPSYTRELKVEIGSREKTWI